MVLRKTLVYALFLISVIFLVSCSSGTEPGNTDTSIESKEVSEGINIGERAPDVMLDIVDGEPVTLSSFKGKAVVLNFWASWCPPCREEMPAFEELHNEHSDALTVIGVNLQESDEDVTRFVDELGISFVIARDPESEVKRRYNVFTQPVTYFIDGEGIIVDKKFGPLTSEEINTKVSSLIGSDDVARENIVDVSTQSDREQDENIQFLDDGTPYTIHPSEFLSGGPPKDGIPSIDNPRFIEAENADKWLPDDELGLGVTYKGVSRFYPFRILVSHEIVNDVISDDPILVTYCPLCFTGIAFIRELDGEPVEFGVSGKLYNSELVMYDRKTDSYWPQSLGRAVLGPSTGKQIQKIASDTVLYGDWKRVYPDTFVLSKDTGFFRGYDGFNPYGADGEFSDINLQFPLENRDARLGEYTIVYGIEVNGAFKAYPRDVLAGAGHIEDIVGGERVIVAFDSDLKSADAHIEDGEELIVETLFWFAWAAFHPETELYSD